MTSADSAMARFEQRTGRYGIITMSAGMLLSIAGPFYLLLFTDLNISWAMVLTAFIAVGGTFGVFWVVEPVSYFPILGPSAMYQAFMIGNISNKLLPAAIVAQSTIDAKPGTRRGDVAAVMAICGAATVHLASLLVFVGLLGTWLVNLIPLEIIEVARLYILPSLMGAVLVQAIVALRHRVATLVAVSVALFVQFVIIPFAPDLVPFATPIAVAASILLALALHGRTRLPSEPGEAPLN